MTSSKELASDFSLWYAEYPRKEARKDALKAWNALKPSAELQQQMHDALRWQIPENGWNQPHRKRFCPLPATYLRGERWTDQPLNPQTTSTTKQQQALQLINALVSEGMDRRQAILKVENELWKAAGHVH